ncbi:MAG: 30S ribosomal protein S11 [Spirochaetes bacterium GWF1_49_6]|jgi:small subunit ribosomal protein S11|nr:MAG: 30S ribosomal protein S11 [Spirochaetes bacterium GWF1_49_6]
MATKKAAVTRKKKEKKNVLEGIVNIQASFNNTLITVTDMNGNALSWSSAGVAGFKGTKKGTPYASQLACEKALDAAKYHGLESVHVRVKGPGPGRESAIRAIDGAGIKVKSIRDITPIPHNGCRPRKKRRV